MTPKKAIEAVSQGYLVRCTRMEYPEIRKALQKYAGKQVDNGQDIYAQISLNEVKRLDAHFFGANIP